MSEIEVLNMLVVSLEDKLKGEAKRCIGWQEHAQSLSRSLELAMEVQANIFRKLEEMEGGR